MRACAECVGNARGRTAVLRAVCVNVVVYVVPFPRVGFRRV